MKNAFKNIQVGAAFYCNGNYCIKRSTRTADVHESGEGGAHYGIFYFRMGETCYSQKVDSEVHPTKRPLRSADRGH